VSSGIEPLPGRTVRVDRISPGVAQITLCDREHKNTFTEHLVADLTNAFAELAADESCRAIILTGYDTYFASGATREGLLALHAGHTTFNVTQFYRLALDCDVPVVAAMQGHAIGGGLVMGLFADCLVLGRENVYAANFMRYGFTPGMGATYILPVKLGFSLAHEMLLGGRSYRGADLEKRGVPFPVLPRRDVLAHAQELASELADKPRLSLVTLKQHLVRTIRRELDAAIGHEIGMHEITFHHDEVKRRILQLF
jgi:polyketide biosynthesis enoyl-CoA hydratase PksI